MTVIAHRGAPTRVLENTLRSIQLAETLRCDATEFDVRSTRDGVPVLLHDRTLQRFWNLPDRVDAVDLATIRTLTARSPDGGTDRIPTFEEVLDGTRAVLVVDCKAAEIIPAMLRMIHARDQFARIRFIGEPPILEHVRAASADAQIVMSWSGLEEPPESLLQRIRPFAINLEWRDAVADLARTLARRYVLWAYTIDDAESARKARETGIEGIISNDLAAIAPGLVPPARHD